MIALVKISMPLLQDAPGGLRSPVAVQVDDRVSWTYELPRETSVRVQNVKLNVGPGSHTPLTMTIGPELATKDHYLLDIELCTDSTP